MSEMTLTGGDTFDPAAIDQTTDDQTGATEAEDGLEDEAPEGDEDEQPAEGDDPELEEVEWDGVKARVPPAIKSALMRTVDYTQKTQALAERSRELEAREQAVETRSTEELAVRVKLARMDDDLAAYDTVDWDALRETNRDEWLEHRDRYRDLKLERGELAANVAETEQRRGLEAREAAMRNLDARLQEAGQVLAGKDGIKGWSPAMVHELKDFVGSTFGVTEAEFFEAATDPRLVKILHAAKQGVKATRSQTAQAQAEQSVRTRPAATVGGGGAAPRRTTDASGDRLTTEEWARQERERVRKQRA